jgi:hypothetical protein
MKMRWLAVVAARKGLSLNCQKVTLHINTGNMNEMRAALLECQSRKINIKAMLVAAR